MLCPPFSGGTGVSPVWCITAETALRHVVSPAQVSPKRGKHTVCDPMAERLASTRLSKALHRHRVFSCWIDDHNAQGQLFLLLDDQLLTIGLDNLDRPLGAGGSLE